MAFKVGARVRVLAGAGKPQSLHNRYGVIESIDPLSVRTTEGVLVVLHGAEYDDVMPENLHGGGQPVYKSELAQRD